MNSLNHSVFSLKLFNSQFFHSSQISAVFIKQTIFQRDLLSKLTVVRPTRDHLQFHSLLFTLKLSPRVFIIWLRFTTGKHEQHVLDLAILNAFIEIQAETR